MMTHAETNQPKPEALPLNITKTECCIVGGGPAGTVLALLLARQGIRVILLEAHKDFDRDFRGDALIPGVMQIMEDLGLAERLLQLHHSKAKTMRYQTAEGAYTITDFSRLRTHYPYLTMLPQVCFLKFIVEEALHYANFELIMGANVQELIEEDGVVCGVRYRKDNLSYEVRASLTVGADGRSSRVRRLGGFKSVKISAPMDVLSFRLPRKQTDPENTHLPIYIGQGYYMGMWNRFEHWQINYAIPKGSYGQLRSLGALGIEKLQRTVAQSVSEFSDRVGHLKDWSQISFLSVESSRVLRWYRPGLLLIGDAAHVMSSVGGVGINCAIQDAVVASNILGENLKNSHVKLSDLAKVQRQREWPTRILQLLQVLVEKKLISRALNPNKPFKMPLSFRIPFVKNLSSRVAGFGVWRVRVKH